MNNNIKTMIGDITADLISNGISIRFSFSKSVPYAPYVGDKNIKCEGWFDESEMVCATNLPEEYWISVLAHEYCHFKQFKEKSKLWASNRAFAIFDGFLEGKKVPTDLLLKSLGKIQIMEADCEKRSVDLLRRYGTGHNYGRITQRANAYITFYNLVRYLGGWYKTPPGMIKEIVDEMPDYFLSDVKLYGGAKIDTSIMKLYKSLCMKSGKENEKF
jgi:hypothetical protein